MGLNKRNPGISSKVKSATSLLSPSPTRPVLLLSAPSRSSLGCLLHRHCETKVMTEKLLARVESKGYKKGAHREKDSTRDDKRHIGKAKNDQNMALDCYILQGIRVSRLLQRSVLARPKSDGHSQKCKYSLQQKLPILDEASSRQRFLREGVDAPDLATAKDFLYFYIATRLLPNLNHSRFRFGSKPVPQPKHKRGHTQGCTILFPDQDQCTHHIFCPMIRSFRVSDIRPISD